MFKKLILLTSFVLALGMGALYAADPFMQSSGPDGIVAMEAEHFHTKVAASSRSWEPVGPTGGFTGAAGMRALPDGGTNINTGYVTTSPHLDFEVAFQKTGTYHVWVRAWGPDGSGDSAHAGLDGQAIATCDRMQGWTNVYAWSKATMDTAPATFDVTSAGVHVVNFYMREDGLIVDKIVLTTNANYTPTGNGPPENPLKASAPIPADGAIEVTDSALQWTAGEGAVSHKVYLSADATIDASDFLVETQLTVVIATVTPGATYYWRVDEVQAGATVIEGDVWSFTTMPLEAHFPNPADGATGVALDAKLGWTAGKGTILNDLYFGTDRAAVEAKAPTTFKGKLNVTSFDPGPLQPFATYYWKVDEFAGVTTNAGPVWSFSTVEYLIISTDETTLNYDNTVAPFYSEVVWDTPQDLTYGGVADLTLRFQGRPGPEGDATVDEATGTYTITGSGADIWGTSDQFHYGYMKLSGDGEIVARVVSNGTGSNLWAKGGVMIRETLAADSKHALMALTGGDGGGIAFQSRQQAGGSSTSYHGDLTAAPPYWVKLTRQGNMITAYSSADGVAWAQMTDTTPDGSITNPLALEMVDPVLIGLFVTSHAAGERRTYTFDNVSVVGNIGSAVENQDIGIASNSAEPLYVTLEDSTGVAAVVSHPDPAATRINQWWKWKIPLAAFSEAGVNLTAAAKLHIGVGNRASPTLGGSGLVRIDDILVVKPVIITEPADVTAPGDNVKGVPNDGDWPGAETPPLAIDDKTSTKYLHFKGETQATGFQVTPSAIQSIVTGLTFTTANDSPERDPIAFELYGSNVSIDGPYELIAAGPIVDFNQPTAAARFTKNTTPISFDNAVAYDHYQVLFPAVRNAATANSMQIAEVELIGISASAAPQGYLFDGDAAVAGPANSSDSLDGTWDHNNGSDTWDGTGLGAGGPGGASALVEDGVTFLRIQDAGDPRDYGMPDPSNRKVYFTHAIDSGLDGARLEFRARVATSPPLDDLYPDGGAGITPWPAQGLGYHIRDNGKGMFGIAEGGLGIISFSLAQPGETGFENVATDVLVMNNLVANAPSANVDSGEAATAANMVAIADATQWNTFVIDIAAGGTGTHIVSVSVNGGPAQSFEVSAGTGVEGTASYIAMGSSGTGPVTAFDVDYISVRGK